MKKNDLLILTAVDYSHEGLAVCKTEGFVVFVKGLLLDETAEVRLIKVLAKHGFGIIEKLLVKSAERVEPRCPLANRCGGCQLQHMSAHHQTQFKMMQVRNQFAHHLDFHAVEDIITMDDPWSYRNKAQVPFTYQSEQLLYGFYREHTHDILPMKRCDIQDEDANRILITLRDFYQARPTSAQALRHALIKKAFSTQDIMVVLISKTPTLQDEAELVETLQRQHPNVKAILINHNPRQDNVILGDTFRSLTTQEKITDVLGGYTFEISASSFYQVNPHQALKLYQLAIECAALTKRDKVLDLYCGVGTIAIFASRQAQSVVGIEINPDAIVDAKRNAELNRLNNVSFVAQKASELLNQAPEFDVVIVDPPRKGLDEETLRALLHLQASRLIYVSCNPSTLVRDLKELSTMYAIKRVIPVDMFPQTYHVETVVMMSRVDK